MKIKTKKAFGEKHQLRRQKRHSTSGATWRDQSARLSLVKVYANAACLAAEAFGEKTAENVAHVAWGDADDALRRLTEEHLPEIEADYGELWAALEAKREAECRSPDVVQDPDPPAAAADADEADGTDAIPDDAAVAKAFADLDRLTLQAEKLTEQRKKAEERMQMLNRRGR